MAVEGGGLKGANGGKHTYNSKEANSLPHDRQKYVDFFFSMPNNSSLLNTTEITLYPYHQPGYFIDFFAG